MGGCCTKGGGDTDSVNIDRKSDKASLLDANSKNSSKYLSNPNSNRTTKSLERESSASSAMSDGELDDLHRVVPAELGQFVIKKMNNKTLDRLWKHLDEDGSGQIERDEVLNILQWMAVLYVAFRFRVQFKYTLHILRYCVYHIIHIY